MKLFKESIPSPDSQSPIVQGLVERLNAVSAKKSAIKLQLEPLNKFLSGDNNYYPTSDGISNSVRELVGHASTPDRAQDATKRLALLKELNDLNQAEDILHESIYKERSRAGAAVCEKVRPENDRLATDFARKLTALYESHAAYSAFLDAVTDVGVSIGPLNPVMPNGLGNVLDRSGTYYYAFKEFKDAGFIADMPKAFR